MSLGVISLTLFVRQDILVFPIDRHALPAPLAVLLVLQHEVTPEVLHASPLLADAVVHDVERRIVSEVEIFTLPSSGEETARSWKEESLLYLLNWEL